MSIDFKTLDIDGTLAIDDVVHGVSSYINKSYAGYRVAINTKGGTTVNLVIDSSDDFDYEIYTKTDQFYGTSDSFVGILTDSDVNKYIEELILALKAHLRKSL